MITPKDSPAEELSETVGDVEINETVPASAIDPELAGRTQTDPKKFKSTGVRPAHFAPELTDVDRMKCSYPTPTDSTEKVK